MRVGDFCSQHGLKNKTSNSFFFWNKKRVITWVVSTEFHLLPRATVSTHRTQKKTLSVFPTFSSVRVVSFNCSTVMAGVRSISWREWLLVLSASRKLDPRASWTIFTVLIIFYCARSGFGHHAHHNSGSYPGTLLDVSRFLGKWIPLCTHALHHCWCRHLPGGLLWLLWCRQREQLHDDHCTIHPLLIF